MKMIQVDQEALTVLSSCKVQGTNVFIQVGTLDRSLYVKVDNVLRCMGGKWNRSAKAHIFDECPEALIDQVLNTGKIAPLSKNGYFPTPRPVLDVLLEFADLGTGMRVLEPSAGSGNIVDGLLEYPIESVCAIEVNPDLSKRLSEKYSGNPRVSVVGADFLAIDVQASLSPVERVVLNPPFENRCDIKHVMSAFNLLAPGGRLVAVMGAGVTFRQDALAEEFRSLAKRCGSIHPLPEGSFKESGTMVNTVVCVLNADRI